MFNTEDCRERRMNAIVDIFSDMCSNKLNINKLLMVHQLYFQ